MFLNNNFLKFDIRTALIASLVLHAIVVFNEFVKVNKNPLENLKIEVKLLPDPKPEPPPVIEKPKPIEPPPPPVIEKPKPIEPPPVIEPIPEKIEEPIPQDVIPKEDAVPIYEEPIQEPVQEVTPRVDQEKIEREKKQLQQRKMDAVELFTNNLAFHISKFKKYPRIAMRRNWQGMVLVRMVMLDNGNIQSLSIEKSSGYEVLDNEAMRMIERAKPLPKPPDILAGDEVNIYVPVSFALN
jgi:protein TonB